MADNTPTIHWEGASGKQYKYWVYKLPHTFENKAGNYIFTKRSSDGNHTPIYIGQTSDLGERFDDHHKKDCIKKHGATHICAHLNAKKTDRLAEESDLLKNRNPPCNG